jgi:hypothetical protein
MLTFFNENVEPTFFNQHFSEKSYINIFREKMLDSTYLRNVSSTFFNIFHKIVDQHFLKMLQHFSGKINIFYPFFHLRTATGGRRGAPARAGRKTRNSLARSTRLLMTRLELNSSYSEPARAGSCAAREP